MKVTWWERLGQAKIALQCPSENELHAIVAKAKAADLVTNLVRDAGHTQVAAGSYTVLAIGPAPESAFNGLTSHLKLL